MRPFIPLILLAAAMPTLPITALADAPAKTEAMEPTVAELAAQIQALRREYEARIHALEAQLETLAAKAQAAQRPAPARPVRSAKATRDNTFNPEIGIILNGLASDFSSGAAEIPGFPLGHEAERAPEGLSLNHTEITASSNIDDRFFGYLTLGLDDHAGEPTEVELEEAYIQTLPGAGLPDGMRIKAGRALWTLGYLNELHAHADDFSDRPLPYRAFLDNAYNDDGLELSLVLPTDWYAEVGAGLFRGDDLPFGGSDDGREAWSAYARLGGDFGRDSAWRVGAYVLDGEARNRGGGHAHAGEDPHAHEEEEMHEDGEEHEDEEHAHAEFFSAGEFSGDVRLHALDFRTTWAPTGNAREREWIFQGEYFWRKEKGTYTLAPEVEGAMEEAEYFDATARGWYLQAVYKFLPKWRIGARYSRLSAPSIAEIGHDPSAVAVMLDWTNSEFSRLRLQYNREDLAGDRHDNQFMLQYIMSLGAHGAHAF